MSTVVRDAVIRVRLEQQKMKAEAGDRSGMTEAVKEHQRAHKEAGETVRRSHRETERVVSHSNERMVASFREGGEGALRMARGIAFLSAAGGDDLRKLVQQVAIAQGAFDVFAGSAKLASNLAVAFGPWGMAIAGVTTAITAGALAWEKYQASAERAVEAIRRQREEARLAAEHAKRLEETLTGIEARGLGRRAGLALTPEERRRREDIQLADINARNALAEVNQRGLAMARKQGREDRAELERRLAEAERIGHGRFRVGEYSSAQAIEEAYAERPGIRREIEEARKRDEEQRKRAIELSKQQLVDIQSAIDITEARNRELTTLAQAQSTAFGVAGGTALGFGQLTNPLFTQAAQQLETVQRAFVAKLQQSLDEIEAMHTRWAKRLARLEGELTAGHTE